MDNKRQNQYAFTSQRDLIAFFADTLQKKTIKETIRNTKKKFKIRSDVSRELNRLQLLKKCEWELVRLSKELLAELENGTAENRQ